MKRSEVAASVQHQTEKTTEQKLNETVAEHSWSPEERARAHSALRRSEDRFAALLKVNSDVLYRMSPDWSEMLQLGGGGFLPDTGSPTKDWLPQYIHPDDQEMVLAAIQNCVRTKTVFELEHRVRRVDGTFGWTLSRAIPLLDDKGEITEWFGAATDISARKQAEEGLRDSEQRYRLLFDSIDEGFCVIEMIFDVDGKPIDYRFLDTNASFERQTGLVDAKGKTIRELAPKHEEYWYEIYGRIALTGEPARFQSQAEELRRWYDVFAFRFGVPEKRQVAVLFQDVSERKRTEQALIRSEKLMSVGRMAATIAHEINNPLAGAMNALYLVSRSPSLSEEARLDAEMAERELQRIAHITKQTLGFYREGGRPMPLDLPQVADGVLDLYGPKLRGKSVVVKRQYRTRMKGEAIEGEVRQIISNLVTNSIDAVQQDGTIWIRTTTIRRSSVGRPMLRLSIADNGSGIRTEDMKRIFEPFFTTKESVGTGLGLWVTRELVTKQGGRIRVRSRLGKGTVFSIFLPMQSQEWEAKSA